MRWRHDHHLDTIQVVKTIASLDRLNNSASGNPRWRVHFTDGTRADTGPDATVGYEIDHEAWQQRPVVFDIDAEGYVTDITHPVSLVQTHPEITRSVKP